MADEGVKGQWIEVAPGVYGFVVDTETKAWAFGDCHFESYHEEPVPVHESAWRRVWRRFRSTLEGRDAGS